MRRLIIVLFLLISGEVISQSDKDFLVVKETLDLIRVSKNEIYYTTNLYKFLVDINNSLTLGFDIENELGKSLTITVDNRKMKVIEFPPSLTDVKNLCILIQPRIEKKLKGFNLKYDYPEYISDYLLTTIDRGSWLISTTFADKNLPKGLNIGIQYRKDSSNYYVIKTIIRNFLGDQAGLLVNDRIIQINGIPTNILGGGALLKELSKVRNEKVLLTITRNGNTIEANLLKRTVITQNPSVDSVAMIADNVAYVKIRKLNTTVSDKLRSLCNSPDKNDLILDFRNCAGGELGAAFDIANIFVPKGDTIFKIKFANIQDTRSRTLVATGENQLTTKRIVILVNGQTASGAEVVVSALKFFKLAKIIGTKTYGNGEIGDALSIDSGMFRVKLTTGQLFGADGIMISDHGIEPDIKVDDSIDIIQFALSQLK